MKASKVSMETNHDRYPWERALLIVVLYGALLIFLWNFPTVGGRTFFQKLFTGILYILAGLVFLGITFVFFLLMPLPFLDEPQPAYDNASIGEGLVSSVLPARSVLVPAFKQPDTELEVWNVLQKLEQDVHPVCVIAADPVSGIIVVTDESAEEVDFVLRELKGRLKQAGIVFRDPR